VIDKESKQEQGMALFDDCSFLAQKNEDELIKLSQCEEHEKKKATDGGKTGEKKKKISGKKKKTVVDVDKIGDKVGL
jgi:hypothetical protein